MHWRTRRDKGRFRTQAEGRHIHLSTDVKVFPRGRNEQLPPPDRSQKIGAETDPRVNNFAHLVRLVHVSIMENVAEESSERKREEYEMQLLGFHSRAVYATSKSPSAFYFRTFPDRVHRTGSAAK